MPAASAPQLNIRSGFARARAAELARATGMTTTQIVEEALRAYLPPPAGAAPAPLVRRGAILVRPAAGLLVSLEAANAALEDARTARDA